MMKCHDGIPSIILENTDLDDWVKTRRSQIFDMFRDEVYGKSPQPGSYEISFYKKEFQKASSGQKFRKYMVKISIKATYGEHLWKAVVFEPLIITKPKVFVYIGLRDLDQIISDTMKVDYDFWPVSEITSKGFITATFYKDDVEKDEDVGYKGGIISCFEKDPPNKKDDVWGTIAAWSFAAGRLLDFLKLEYGDDLISAVIGHSRGGKAALWCGACDTRFDYVISNNSGCTGAAMSRTKKGERVKDINTTFPYWFCGNYKKYNNRESYMPFDQHMLLSLIAPRLLYVASATNDDWADPKAEFLSTYLASEAYGLYGMEGIKDNKMPHPDGFLHEGSIAYHLREGDHSLTKYDWMLYMEYFLKKF